jgi:hypothetical protein
MRSSNPVLLAMRAGAEIRRLTPVRGQSHWHIIALFGMIFQAIRRTFFVLP